MLFLGALALVGSAGCAALDPPSPVEAPPAPVFLLAAEDALEPAADFDDDACRIVIHGRTIVCGAGLERSHASSSKHDAASSGRGHARGRSGRGHGHGGHGGHGGGR